MNETIYFSSVPIGPYIFIQSLYLPIGVLSIIGNSLVLVTFIKYKTLREADCADLVAALSFGDLICGAGAIFISLARLEIALLKDFNFTRFYCIFSAVPNLFGIEMSQAMTMAIAIDRLFAVSNPFAYRVMNHRRYAKISFAISIFCGCIVLVLSTAGVDFGTPPSRCQWSTSVQPISLNIYVTGNALVGPIVAVIYATVIYKQRKWNKHTSAGKGDAAIKKFLDAQAKMTTMLTRLVVVYCILVAAPLTIFEFWTVSKISPEFTSAFISPMRNIMVSFNSAVNVVVYAHSSSNIRPFLINLLTCGKKGALGSPASDNDNAAAFS
uniref:G-protein coupled receptors family 1 profile domain-containing protein n=1 Tax=Plectus sambesii TaxID=2011161 RepID=A0A914WQ58_9BILA